MRHGLRRAAALFKPHRLWQGKQVKSAPDPAPFAAIILAAGQGTRMKSARHKVLHAVAGQPMLRHLTDSLSALGPARTVVVVGAMKDQVEAEVAGFAEVVVQQPQRGTGHAVLQAAPALASFSGKILILYGDAPLVPAATMARLLAALTGNVAVAVLGFRPANPGAYGRIVATDGAIQKMVEFKDACAAERAETLCNSGLMAVRSADLFALLARVTDDNAAGEYYLPDIVGLSLADNRLCVVIETAAVLLRAP